MQNQSISLNVIRVAFVVIAIYVGITVAMGESLDKGWIGGLCGLGFGILVVLLDIALRNFSIRGFSTGTVGVVDRAALRLAGHSNRFF